MLRHTTFVFSFSNLSPIQELKRRGTQLFDDHILDAACFLHATYRTAAGVNYSPACGGMWHTVVTPTSNWLEMRMLWYEVSDKCSFSEKHLSVGLHGAERSAMCCWRDDVPCAARSHAAPDCVSWSGFSCIVVTCLNRWGRTTNQLFVTMLSMILISRKTEADSNPISQTNVFPAKWGCYCCSEQTIKETLFLVCNVMKVNGHARVWKSYKWFVRFLKQWYFYMSPYHSIKSGYGDRFSKYCILLW